MHMLKISQTNPLFQRGEFENRTDQEQETLTVLKKTVKWFGTSWISTSI